MKQNLLSSLSQIILITLGGCYFITDAKGQCAGVSVSAYASKITINCGDSVNLGANGNQGTTVYTNNFNATCPGAGWTGTSSATCTNPCGNGPSGAGGDPYVWMGNTATAPRNLTTVGYNVSNGGTICFDMRYASEESCPGPGACSAAALTCSCEGPDLTDEGVHLQYQKNGVGPWIDMQYWDPSGGCDPNLVNWNRHCVTLPPGSYGATTKFRWFQTASSSTDADHWGIDNVVITVPNIAFTYDWAHDNPAVGPNISPTVAAVAPTSTTTYTVTYSNGTCSATGTVTVNVNAPSVSVTAAQDTLCAGGSTQLTANSSLIMTCPTTCGLSGQASCNPNNSKAVEYQIGAGTIVTGYNNGTGSGACAGASGESTFGDFGDDNRRTQMIFTAAELIGAGFTCGSIKSILFDFNRIQTASGGCTTGSALTYNNLQIQMACLPAATDRFSGGFLAPAFSTVYSYKATTVKLGWHEFQFDQTYDWDGVSNILIQICWYDAVNDGTAFTSDNNVGIPRFITAIYNTGGDSDPCSSADFITQKNIRPNIKIGACVPIAGTLTYNWSPATGLNNPNIYNPIASPTSTTTYTVSVNQSGISPLCAATGTAKIVINNGPPLSVNTGPCSNGAGSRPLVANGQTFCNTTFGPNSYNTNTFTADNCITVSGISPTAFSTSFLNAFIDIRHADATEVDLEIKGPGVAYQPLAYTGGASGQTYAALPAAFNGIANVNSATWCIHFKDNCTATGLCGVNDGGATLAGWCLTFKQGTNSGVTYAWSPSAGLTPNATSQGVTAAADGNPSTAYTVTATNSIGCTTTAAVTVNYCPLPVTLLSFTGTSFNNKVKLNWITSSEINSDRFEIEKSTDAVEFYPIGSVKAAGNSTSEIQYQFIDENPVKGTNYYRLKQIDNDGEYEHSQMIPIEFGSGLMARKLRPVPATDKLSYDIVSSKEQTITVEIFDLLGKKMSAEIKTLKQEANTLVSDVSMLPPGVYLLKITDNTGEPYIQKFVK